MRKSLSTPVQTTRQGTRFPRRTSPHHATRTEYQKLIRIRKFLGTSLANALSFSRIPLAVMIVLSTEKGQRSFSFFLIMVMDLSDVLDGLVARHFKCQTTLGAVLDCGADFAALLGLFAFQTWRGESPAVLLGAMVLAFLSYILRSTFEGRIAKTRYGKHSGSLLYGFLTIQAALELFSPTLNLAFIRFGSAIAILGLSLSVLENTVYFMRRICSSSNL